MIKIRQRWSAFIIQILNATQSAAPIILATIFTTLVDVSIFSIYMLVINAISGLLGIFMSSITSSFGEVISRGELDTLKLSFGQFETGYYMLITTIFTVTIIMFYSFIQIYTRDITDINYASFSLVIYITINAFVYNLKVPQGMLVMAAGKFDATMISTIIQTSILIGLGLILSFIFGLNGIVIASIVSNLYRLIDFVIFVPKEILKSNATLSVKKIFLSIIIFTTFGTISYIFPIADISIVTWIVYSIVLTISIFLITFLLYFCYCRTDIKGVISRLYNFKKDHKR